jgi:hypothetical protein
MSGSLNAMIYRRYTRLNVDSGIGVGEDEKSDVIFSNDWFGWNCLYSMSCNNAIFVFVLLRATCLPLSVDWLWCDGWSEYSNKQARVSNSIARNLIGFF